MAALLDRGILIRAVNRDDSRFPVVRRVIRLLKSQNEELVMTLQNASEFWNVCTRPASARGGLGASVEQARRRLRFIERYVKVLPEPAGMYENGGT
jgi:hypothetical protein